MPVLTKDEALQIYNGPLTRDGHPDPLGYIGRSMVLTDLNPRYIDTEGRVGLMPITPIRAAEFVSDNPNYIEGISPNTLAGNLAITIGLELQNYAGYNDIEKMIIAFHDGIENINVPSEETRDIISNIDKIRQIAQDYLFPPLATFEDFKDIYSIDDEVTGREFEIADRILRG